MDITQLLAKKSFFEAVLKEQNVLEKCLILVDCLGARKDLNSTAKRDFQYRALIIQVYRRDGFELSVDYENRRVFQAESNQFSPTRFDLPKLSLGNTHITINAYIPGEWENVVNILIENGQQEELNVSDDVERAYEGFKH